MLRQTPFELVLPGCTVAELQAAIPAATLPREFNAKVRDGILLLRNYGGAATPWSVKARMEQAPDGVRLSGRLRYLLDRIYFAGCVLMAAILLAVAAGVAISQGTSNGGFGTCVTGAIVLGLVAFFAVKLQPGAVAKKEQRAQEVLRGIL
jgi:hypothetical protein